MTSICSSKLTVADSPVVPTDTIPFVPSLICHSINLSKESYVINPGDRVTFYRINKEEYLKFNE